MVYNGPMFNAFRDGQVVVCAKQCATCIYGPRSPIDLERRHEMEAETKRRDSAIICHSTLDGDHAVCRGYYDRQETTPLRLAKALWNVREVIM